MLVILQLNFAGFLI